MRWLRIIHSEKYTDVFELIEDKEKAIYTRSVYHTVDLRIISTPERDPFHTFTNYLVSENHPLFNIGVVWDYCGADIAKQLIKEYFERNYPIISKTRD